MASKIEGVAESGDVDIESFSSSDDEEEEEEVEEEEEDALYKAKGKGKTSQGLAIVKKEFQAQLSSSNEDSSDGEVGLSKGRTTTQHSSKALKMRSPSEKVIRKAKRKIMPELEKTEEYKQTGDSPKHKKPKSSKELVLATPSLSTSTSFMMQRRALPALADLYKVIKVTKSSSTSTSSVSVLTLPGPSNDTIMVAKEKLLSYLAHDVEDVVSFHLSLASTIVTLKKHSEFPDSIQASLTKLQHQLQFIVAHVSSSTSIVSKYEKEAKLREKALEDFQLSLESYPEIKDRAEKLMIKKEELNEELAKV
ncbi:uncharacterized protein LOC132309048 [Cornus florida]|uniref:uncharacterized protein LOC132309048 n=1 Tax=Cornus florida TaxID=4283 RepID=UPI00289C536E|nr:uncharacterized protein LOC132309048 [Cornus florida]